jgi:hypothetical protein
MAGSAAVRLACVNYTTVKMLPCFNSFWSISWFEQNLQADGKNMGFKHEQFLLLNTFLEKDK